MNIVLWMGVGGALGWLGCKWFDANVHRGLLVSVIIGVVAAFVGGHVLAPLFGGAAPESGAFSPFALVVAFASAIGCLAAGDMIYERFGM